MKLMRDASLQLSSTSTPKTFAMACWLSIRLPFATSALNTTFRPLPLGVIYTSKIPFLSFREESRNPFESPEISPCASLSRDDFGVKPQLSNTARGSSTWSISITTRPVSRVAACLRQAPNFPLADSVSSNVAWKINAGNLRFSEASPVSRYLSMFSFHFPALTSA